MCTDDGLHNAIEMLDLDFGHLTIFISHLPSKAKIQHFDCSGMENVSHGLHNAHKVHA